MRSEAEGKRNADMLQFLGDFADVDMGKSSKFANQEKVLFSKETETVDANAPKPPSEEEMQKARDAAVAELEAQVGEANGSLDELQEAIATFTSEIQEMLIRTGEVSVASTPPPPSGFPPLCAVCRCWPGRMATFAGGCSRVFLGAHDGTQCAFSDGVFE